MEKGYFPSWRILKEISDADAGNDRKELAGIKGVIFRSFKNDRSRNMQKDPDHNRIDVDLKFPHHIKGFRKPASKRSH